MVPAAAGTSTKFGGESTASCLAIESRPDTPPNVRRWRKSNFQEPGKRVVHPGTEVKDTTMRFGKIKVEPEHAVVYEVSAFSLVKEAQQEACYLSRKREPLGTSFTRGHSLPENCTFGVPSAASADAKSLIYAPDAAAKASRRALEPGEQKKRNYDCEMPERFGLGLGSHVAFNGLALGAEAALKCADRPTVTATRVQNKRALDDKVGCSRKLSDLKLDPDTVFGKSLRTQGDARSCFQGSDDEPDKDLGTTQTPGFRNLAAEDRTYGVPTVRSDVPKPSRRSVADAQNYGDDPTAADLLYPTLVSADAATKPRTQDELKAISDAIGVDDATFHDIYAAAARPDGTLTLDAFHRHLLLARSS